MIKPTSPRTNVFLLLALAAIPLTGCQQAAPVTGKVIRGDVSFIGVVEASDERLKLIGLQGAEVTATNDPNSPAAAAVLAKATSDAKGNFSLRIADQSTLTRATGFTAKKEGFLPASSAMPMPSEDRRLLVILKPMGPAPNAAPRNR